MGLNMGMIILGTGLVVVALFLFIKEQRNMQEPQDPWNVEQSELYALRGEVADLKQQLAQMEEMITELQTSAPAPLPEEEGSAEGFEQLLNYTRFSQKNQQIIKLYQLGRTPEEIARDLGKSIREVEMVIKLIR